MYDRFSELKSIAAGSKTQRPVDCVIINIDDFGPNDTTKNEYIDNNSKADTNFVTENRDLNSYMAHIEVVRAYINKIHASSNAIRSLMTRIVSSSTIQQEEELSNKLNAIVTQTNEECANCKNAIMELKEKRNRGNSTEAQIRENAYNVSLKQFQSALKEYRDAQTQFRKTSKAKTARQLQIAYPEMNNEDLKKVENGSYKAIESILQSKIIGNHTLKDAIVDIQEKYKDVISLEKSVEELHQMIIDLAGLVSYQGELIYQIEHNALKAVEYTDKANDELKKAEDYKRSGSKIMIWIAFGITIASVFVIVPVVFKSF
ncbi:syntaxin 1B/2/3 [Babesia microti strain RI]|uniref:Syntaxin 1B/2/3 n=1 Tax=Babesia microti (strain RI) TaxID=1133968 RepID=I7I9Y9_BABMR|nr:syntaxin 1B/2/3 [Babesia microti strain RI]CCF75869.1 syntaxin 1B/2/3 [Babesia microti strain RI]|eukprot:XP_012650277.1 syntaxin 1B/2/3 [Babesia microti strain RI]